MKLSIVVASTRPGRVGLPIAQWFHARAKEHGKLDAELVDLKEVELPIFDEPKHPRFQQYEHDHTKKWSAIVAAADAFVIVTPEYNFSAPPSIVNALDYLFREWQHKPAGFVSYGGVSGGLRSVQMMKQVVTTLKMMPIPEAVTIPFFNTFINDESVFTPNELHEKSAVAMFDELLRWESALRVLRT